MEVSVFSRFCFCADARTLVAHLTVPEADLCGLKVENFPDGEERTKEGCARQHCEIGLAVHIDPAPARPAAVVAMSPPPEFTQPSTQLDSTHSSYTTNRPWASIANPIADDCRPSVTTILEPQQPNQAPAVEKDLGLQFRSQVPS